MDLLLDEGSNSVLYVLAMNSARDADFYDAYELLGRRHDLLWRFAFDVDPQFARNKLAKMKLEPWDLRNPDGGGSYEVNIQKWAHFLAEKAPEFFPEFYGDKPLRKK